jgi:predicted MFS family arabinose efflux permease
LSVDAQPTATPSLSAWAPLRHPAFRLAWLAFLAVQLANWSETVGAVAVIAGQSESPALLALVQTASTLPAVLLALPAGVAADLVERRLLIVLITLSMAASMAVLAALVAAGAATPVVVLLLTLAMGCGVAMAIPSFAALIQDLVPPADVPGAVTLNGISINLARALGPAIAGAILALAGATALFVALAAALVAVAAMLVVQPGGRGAPPARGDGVIAAMRAGVGFARRSADLRAVLARGAAFVIPASALWALMPAVAVQRLDLDPAAFGGILAALGAGAVAGAQLLPWLRARLGLDLLVAGGTAYGAVNLVLLAVLDSEALVIASLVVAGAAWISVLSSLHTAAQLAAPAWVRGRALSVNQLVFSGGMAAGSAVWGVVADAAGLGTALAVAAALLVLSMASVARWRLGRVGTR